MGKRARDDSTDHISRRADQISRREFFRKSLSLTTALGASSLIAGSAVKSEIADALESATLAGLGGSVGNPSPSPAPRPSVSRHLSRATVILARKSDRGSDLQAFYRLLINSSLKRLAKTERPEDAWAGFFKPDDVVAIKVNTITGRMLSTSPALVSVIAAGLMSCGVRPNKIIVWDRASSELSAAGFRVNLAKEGPLCFGTDATSAGYETSPTILGAVGSCFSRIVTEEATALINVPILREHSAAGVSIALKNNYGAIHNPNKYHADGCSPFVADVNTHPDLKKKTRLVICDALKVQFHSGPGYKPKWLSDFGGVLISADPVALDTVGTEQIDKLRKTAGLRSLGEERRYPRYLSVASDGSHALGISDRSLIDVTTMEPA